MTPAFGASATWQDAAKLVGAHCWSERRAFEMLGGWVPEVDDAGAKVTLDRHSAHCAWRAQQWEDRLPVGAGICREDLVAPPSAPIARMFQAAAGAGGATGRGGAGGADAGARLTTVARLAVAYRVILPRVVIAYRTHLASTSPVADRPTQRSLVMALADSVEDWAEGEGVLQVLLIDTEAVRAAAEAVTGLERLVAEPG